MGIESLVGIIESVEAALKAARERNHKVKVVVNPKKIKVKDRGPAEEEKPKDDTNPSELS